MKLLELITCLFYISRHVRLLSEGQLSRYICGTGTASNPALGPSLHRDKVAHASRPATAGVNAWS